MSQNSPWYKRRFYAHFDNTIPEGFAEKIVKDPERVAAHAFWPLIVNAQKTVSRRGSPGNRCWVTKKRPIAYAAHADSHIFSYYAFKLNSLLEKIYAQEKAVDQSVLAYRKHQPPRCNIHFAKEAFDEIKDRESCDVVALDIDGFFDNLDPVILKRAWIELLGTNTLPPDHFSVFRAVTRSYGITLSELRDVFGGEVPRRAGQVICSPQDFRQFVTPKLQPLSTLVQQIKGTNTSAPAARKGIPQGLPISAVLANLYMLQADKSVVEFLQKIGGSYRRYSDDILLIVPKGKGALAEGTMASFLQKIGLAISCKKTKRYAVRKASCGALQVCSTDDKWAKQHSEPVSYLGLTFNGDQIRIRDSTIANFMFKATKGVKRAYIAAKKNHQVKLKKRLLYARYTSLGYGKAYGREVYIADVLPKGAPRLGFFKYLQLAERVTGSDAIRKQSVQIENQVFRLIAKTDKKLRGLKR